MSANLENSAVATGLKKVSFQTTTQFHSFWILVRLCSKSFKLGFSIQQYGNQELPDTQTGFRKGRGTRDQAHWIIDKAREFQKNIYFCLIDYTNTFDCVDHNKLENC